MKSRYGVLSVEAAREYEAKVLRGEEDKIRSALIAAGKAVGEEILNTYEILRDWPECPRILMICGKGLNTGDGLVALDLIDTELDDLHADLIMAEGEMGMNPLTAEVLKSLFEKMGNRLNSIDLTGDWKSMVLSSDYDVIIDGLYGAGFRHPLRPEIENLLHFFNERKKRDDSLRVSIDLPSGVCETFAPAFKADVTVVPGVAKDPLFSEDYGDCPGKIIFRPLSAFQDEAKAHQSLIVSQSEFHWLRKPRENQSTKRDYGHVLSVSGSPFMPGACLMSGQGILKAGAGLLTTFTPEKIAPYIAGQLPESMWQPIPQNPDGSLVQEVASMVNKASESAHALLVGPGLQIDKTTLFGISRIVRESLLPLVLDASALRAEILSALSGRAIASGPVIMTPHLGEYRRMLGINAEDHDLGMLKMFAKRHRAIVVLKGSPTVVSDGKSIYYVPAGGPVLARGGSGDILAGMLTGLLAQYPDRPLDVALAGVTWHGAAADLLARDHGEKAVRTTQLIDYLSLALRGA